MQLSFLLSILLLSKCIYTLNKRYLDNQIISGIKYCCSRGVSGKRQIQTSLLQEWYSFQHAETTASDQIRNTHSYRNTYNFTPIREAEDPENVPKWSL